jgi:glucose/arabinose dehydrogenase
MRWVCGVCALLLCGGLLAAPPAQGAPALRVTVVVSGLDHPWDVGQLPGGRLLVTERDRQRLVLIERGRKVTVRLPGARIVSRGETGLMGLAVDPQFGTNRRIYTCQGWRSARGTDIRVIAWTMSRSLRSARLARTLIAGIPMTSGRHGGCRLLIPRDGSLLVGTGDAAVGSNPRDLTSLGGKTLRVNRITGRPWRGNPFLGSANARTRLVFTYGHRNVQGLAQRADGSLWSVEQGTWRDDEVNRLVAGGDYGYHPVPGYDESVPMTDHLLPGRQQSARWSSGPRTNAASGGTFLPQGWRSWNGSMVVACLKDQRLVVLRPTRTGRLVQTATALTGHGRLRTPVVAPNGDLLLTTDNGGGADVVLRVRPRA